MYHPWPILPGFFEPHSRVLHVYGEQDWRGFLIKPGSQVRIPERGSSNEEVLEKLKAALRERLHSV